MKFMKIPNRAVLALIAVFLLVGLVALPLSDYPVRLLQFAVILAIGFFLNLISAIGAGDAKFAAAMAPFVALGDIQFITFGFAAVVVAAVVVHRLVRRNSAVRRIAPDWESWTRKDFPMGLALGAGLGFYLTAGAIWGA